MWMLFILSPLTPAVIDSTVIEMISHTQSFPVHFLEHGRSRGAESWVAATVNCVVIAPDREIPSRSALVVLGANGEAIFQRIISETWDTEVKATSMNIGIGCIANPGHVHWYSFHFADSETLGKFQTAYEEGLDLAEAYHQCQSLRVEMIANILRATEEMRKSSVTA